MNNHWSCFSLSSDCWWRTNCNVQIWLGLGSALLKC